MTTLCRPLLPGEDVTVAAPREGRPRSCADARSISPAPRFLTAAPPAAPRRPFTSASTATAEPRCSRLASLRTRPRSNAASRSSSCGRSNTAFPSASSTALTCRCRSTRPDDLAHARRTVLRSMSTPPRPTKYIFVTGGVVSSLGKGLAAASIGALLEGHGYKVALQKFDPYINVDPGTMSPYQHGEVFVTDDGAETDLDLGPLRALHRHDHDPQQQLDHRQDLHVGHPEGAARRLPRADRAGDSAHHQRDQGQHPRRRPRRRRRARRDRRHGRRHREPAVPRGHPPVPPGRRPRAHALHPPDAGALDRLGRRAEDQADAAQRPRPALDRHPARHPAVPHRPHASTATSSRRSPCSATSIEEAVITARDVETIYEVPLALREEGIDRVVLQRLGLPPTDRRRARLGSSWSRTSSTRNDELTIHVVGKYTGYEDSYKSLNEALYHGGFAHRLRINIQWVEAEALEQEGGTRLLEGAAGILVPGGFGTRGTRGMMKAAEFARTPRRALLRHLLRLAVGDRRVRPQRVRARRRRLDRVRRGRARTRSSTSCATCSAWTTWAARCGSAATPASWRPARWPAASTATDVIRERHRHRFEFNRLYEPALKEHGMRHLGPLARRQVRRDRGAAGPPVVPRRAVPSRVPVAAAAAAPAVRELRRGRRYRQRQSRHGQVNRGERDRLRHESRSCRCPLAPSPSAPGIRWPSSSGPA